MRYLHTPGEIAKALRALADDFDDAPEVRLPDLAVSLDIQVCVSAGTEPQRIAAVDLLSFAVAGVDGELFPRIRHYGTPSRYETQRDNGVGTNVFTAEVTVPDGAVAA